MMPLTERQEQLWRFIKGCQRSPSFQEMVDALGYKSKSRIHDMLNALERKGYITTIGQGPGGYRMARSIVANDGPRPDLAGYTTDELADELSRRVEELAA
jgi:SOS-response transcriptional repressor LexA